MLIHSSPGVRASALWTSVALAALAISPANATLIQSQGPFAFSGSVVQPAAQHNSGSTSTAASKTFASQSISKFNSSTGVLTGVQVNLSGNRTESVALDASGGKGSARRADASG